MNRQDFNIIQLPDGRKLSYADYGDPHGKPLFFFHGFPGSRYDGEYCGQVAAEMGIRLIAPDRPGMGYSDFQPNRRLLDWPVDVGYLGDTLELDQFGVLGYSGGGPHALACAVCIPERLTTVGVMAGVGPVTEPGALNGMMRNNIQIFKLSKQVPWLLSLIYRWNMMADGEKLMRAGMPQMAKPDQAVMGNPEVLRGMAKDYKEAFRQNPRGVVQEGALFACDWGFKLSDIMVTVLLWQGEVDTNVPVEMGRYQASQLPNCNAKYFSNEGHISIVTNHIREILAEYI